MVTKRKEEVTLAEVSNLFRYEDGVLYWKQPNGSGVKSGDVAGAITKYGYIQIRLFERSYRRSHIVWFMHTGYWPKEIDHDNRNKVDDRFENLKEANAFINNHNKGARSNTGVKGVSYSKNRYRVHIKVNSNKFCASFKTLPEAVAEAKRVYTSFGIPFE